MTKQWRVVADENIPGLDELLGNIACIQRLPGRKIRPEDVRDADILLVRSVTQVNAELLKFSAVRFVGTCTIGTDHVDLDYLAAQNIAFSSAPGCNAAAVVDYVFAALFAVLGDVDAFRHKTVGVVGCGEVGGRLLARLQALGVMVKVCDPFKIQANASLEEVLGCDIISLHVPYTRNQQHATHHLLDDKALSAIKPSALLINTSRGPVVDNQALMAYLQAKKFHVVLDVYEDEPAPAMALLEACDIATAHIAGYSLHGKLRGTQQVVQALFKALQIHGDIPDLLQPLTRLLPMSENVRSLVLQAYDIRADSRAFMEVMRRAVNNIDKAELFDRFRKDYPVRYEWGFTQISDVAEHSRLLEELGFKVNRR